MAISPRSRQRYSALYFRWRQREIRDNEAERGREWGRGKRGMEQKEKESNKERWLHYEYALK